jgi:hypothetical protein
MLIRGPKMAAHNREVVLPQHAEWIVENKVFSMKASLNLQTNFSD